MKHFLLTTAIIFFFVFSSFSQINKLWHFNAGGANIDNILDIKKDTAGNVYITGSFTGTVDFDPSPAVYNLSTAVGHNTSDAFIQKLDANGNFLWAKKFSGTTNALTYGRNLAIDDTGNVYLTGLYKDNIQFTTGGAVWSSGTSNYSQTFLVKLDSAGNVKWGQAWSANGATNTITTKGLLVHPNGKIYLTGYFLGTIDFDAGSGVTNRTSIAPNGDIFIMRLSGNGIFETDRVLADNVGGNIANCIAQDANGDIYVSGGFRGTIDFDNGAGTAIVTSVDNNNWDAFITKIDATLNHIWVKAFGAVGYQVINATSVSANGSIYNVGAFTQTVDFNPNAGISNLTSAGLSDAFIQKLDVAGNFVWVKQASGITNVEAFGVDCFPNDDVAVTGHFFGTIDFDPSSAVQSLASNGSSDGFAMKLNSNGSLVGAVQFGGTSDDILRAIQVTSAHEFIVGGEFKNTLDVDPTGNTQNITSAGDIDMIAIRLSTCSNSFFTLSATACGSYTLPSGTATYTTSGTYIDTIPSAIGCDSILTINLTILPDLFPTITQTINGLEANAVGSNFSYQWLDCTTNQIVPGAAGQTFMPAANGIFAVIVDDGICTDTSTCFAINNISISENNLLGSITLYPNPTTGLLLVESMLHIEKIEVLDVMGRVVLNSGEANVIDLAFLPTGVYLVKIETANGVVVRRVVKN